jgi:predicted PhzF superfamily epimerase YddE/YHI9
MKKPELVAYQASERGGTVRMRFSGGERVQIGGRAVTVWKGDLDIP